MTVKYYTPATLVAGLAAACLAMPGGATADTIASLEARIAALEASEKAAVAPPLTNRYGMQLSFYGRVKVDAVFDNNYGLGPATGGIALISAGAATDSDQQIHAYQTLFGFRAEQDTEYGKLRFNIEGDFFGGGGGTVRLRHAFGQLGGWTIGQTWSTFSVLPEVPAVSDFNGTAGPANYRTPLVRYSTELGQGSQVEIGFEEDYVTWGARPAVALSLRQKFDKGSLRLGYISRELRTAQGEVDAWGANIGGTLIPWEGGLIQASYTRGEGISSIMGFSGYAGQQASATDARTFFDAGSDGRAVEMDGFFLAVSHKIRPDLTVLAAYGSQSYDRFAGAQAQHTEKLESFHLSTRYNLLENFALGGEVIWDKRTQFNRESVDNTRLQLSAVFDF